LPESQGVRLVAILREVEPKEKVNNTCVLTRRHEIVRELLHQAASICAGTGTELLDGILRECLPRALFKNLCSLPRLLTREAEMLPPCVVSSVVFLLCKISAANLVIPSPIAEGRVAKRNRAVLRA
jgi:hypothetical protein